LWCHFGMWLPRANKALARRYACFLLSSCTFSTLFLSAPRIPNLHSYTKHVQFRSYFASWVWCSIFSPLDLSYLLFFSWFLQSLDEFHNHLGMVVHRCWLSSSIFGDSLQHWFSLRVHTSYNDLNGARIQKHIAFQLIELDAAQIFYLWPQLKCNYTTCI
jgi:hypothetical protein